MNRLGGGEPEFVANVVCFWFSMGDSRGLLFLTDSPGRRHMHAKEKEKKANNSSSHFAWSNVKTLCRIQKISPFPARMCVVYYIYATVLQPNPKLESVLTRNFARCLAGLRTRSRLRRCVERAQPNWHFYACSVCHRYTTSTYALAQSRTFFTRPQQPQRGLYCTVQHKPTSSTPLGLCY